MILLSRSALVKPLSAGSSPHYKRHMDILVQVHLRATKMIKGLEHLLYKERLRELELFHLEKQRLTADDVSKGGGDRLFSVVPAISSNT